MKWCPRCREEKTTADFGPNRSTPDGYQAYCRSCHREAQRDWRRLNPEKAIAVGGLGVVSGVASALADGLLGGVLSIASPILLALAVYFVSKQSWEELRQRLDFIEARRPLRISGHADHNNYRRLLLKNPNAFDVADAFVEVENYSDLTNYSNRDLPPQGFRFAWATQQLSDGKIPAGESIICDIVCGWVDGTARHLRPSANAHKNAADFPIDYGSYQATVVVGSRSSNIPTARYELEITHQEYPDLLRVRYRPDRGGIGSWQ